MIAPLLLMLLTPGQAAIRALVDQDMRVATIGARLARAADVELCAGQYLSTAGLVVQDAAQYSLTARDDARAAVGLGDGPTIVGIVGGDQAGVQRGDVITAINGTAIVTTPRAAPYNRVAQVEAAMEAAPGREIMLDIARGGMARRVTVQAIPGCRSRFQIVRGGLSATQADGRYVQISDGMMALTANDDQLAAVIAHELAHNILRHTPAKTPSKQAEYEADALSVRLVARAGYDLDDVLPFWEALRRRTDYGIFADGTHPGWRKRIAALASAVAAAKERASQPHKDR